MASWYRAAVLTRLVAAVNRWRPGRDKKSDGSIGDQAHQARKSDHNPDRSSRPPGVVRAQDTDRDGIPVRTLVASLLLHASTAYVIFNKVIYARSRLFRPARYLGSNAHTGHVHDSIRKGYENNPGKFVFINSAANWDEGVRRGAGNAKTRQVQAMLIANGAAMPLDGKWGDATDEALRKYQRARGLKIDGVAGPKTLKSFLSR